jgi:hypothetical protein
MRSLRLRAATAPFMLELRLITGDPISGAEDYHDGLD